jgi:ABC-type branched-subunit amino acid transport system ATPase component
MTVSAEALEMRDVSAGYGASDIIASVTLQAARGRITTIAGPNGAGKSTLMKTLVGLLPPRRGEIVIGGRDITHLSPSQRALAGLGYVPQERNVFKNLTIGENLRIGFEFIRRKVPEKEFRASRDRVLDLFPDLSERLGEVAGTLSGGQRQMLAMGCALIPGPSTLLLDEPSAGLSPRYVTTMLDAVAAVNGAGVTVIMIEQNLIEAMRISHDVILLVSGEIKGKWDAQAFLADPAVRSLFLGGAKAKTRGLDPERISDDASAA